MASARTCGECAYLERTSAEQVFLRCKFWCGNHHSVHDQHYVETHCHMQPWAEACDWWLRKEIGERREQVKEKKLRKKLRKRVIKLLRFAAENNIEHVSMFANIEDGKPFIYAMASNGGNNLMAPIVEFVDGGADE